MLNAGEPTQGGDQMNSYASDQLAKLSVADRLRAAELARTARAAQAAGAQHVDGQPVRARRFTVTRRVRALGWLRTA
jgi:hypothetical protein